MSISTNLATPQHPIRPERPDAGRALEASRPAQPARNLERSRVVDAFEKATQHTRAALGQAGANLVAFGVPTACFATSGAIVGSVLGLCAAGVSALLGVDMGWAPAIVHSAAATCTAGAVVVGWGNLIAGDRAEEQGDGAPRGERAGD
jgi:hypothetical protein